MLTHVSEETFKAHTQSLLVVTNTPTRTIPTSLVTKSSLRVWSTWTLLQLTCRPSIADITQTAHGLHGIPWLRVDASRLVCQNALGEARTAVVAVLRAGGSLTSNTIIAVEAMTLSRGSVALALVAALHPGVQVVGADHVSHPSKVLGTGAQRAVRASPGRLSIDAHMALAVAVHLALTVAVAVVLAQTSLAAAAVPIVDHLAPPLRLVGGCRGGHTGGLARRLGRGLHSGLLRRIAARLAGGLACGLERWLH